MMYTPIPDLQEELSASAGVMSPFIDSDDRLQFWPSAIMSGIAPS